MLIPLLLIAPMETVVAMDTACSHSLDLVCVPSGKVCLYMNIDKDHLIHSDLVKNIRCVKVKRDPILLHTRYVLSFKSSLK